MSARLIGYARAAATAPALAEQQETLRAAGCTVIFSDDLSTRRAHRFAQRAVAIAELQEGDTLVVCSLGPVARSLPDLVATIWSVICLGCSFRSLAESLTLRPDGPDEGRAVLSAIAAAAKAQDAEIFAETEKSRQTPRGRKDALSDEDWPAVKEMLETHSITEVARHFRVSRPTIYKLRDQMTHAGRDTSDRS